MVNSRGVAAYQPHTISGASGNRQVAYLARETAPLHRAAAYVPHTPIVHGRVVETRGVEARLLHNTSVSRFVDRSMPSERDDDPASYPLVGLIASKNPVSALCLTVQSLFDGGVRGVVVVDDGSDDPDSMAVFDEVEALGAEVVHLQYNMGKAKALRHGFARLPRHCIVVQTDDDTLAGDLSGPVRIIREGKADIVDIRIETTRSQSLIGLAQELDYWLINAVTKRFQDMLRSRLWMSGASVMYSYEAGQDLILATAKTMTEDTEGLFRTRSKGWRVRYYSKHEGQFLTMVPEDFTSLHKQWKRWATGNGQVIGLYGLGGGNARIAAVNVFSWFNLVVLPVLVTIEFGIVSALLWGYIWGLTMGLVGSVRLKRLRLIWAGVFLPYISLLWTLHALQGLVLAYRLSRSGNSVLTWVSPKRTELQTSSS